MKKTVLILTIAIFGVLGVSAQTTKPIGIKKAKEIALKQVSGKVSHSQTIKESGKPVYLIDIKSQPGNLTKLKIDSEGNVVQTTAVTAPTIAQKTKTHKKKHWWIF